MFAFMDVVNWSLFIVIGALALSHLDTRKAMK
jgi:hypothetical protein